VKEQVKGTTATATSTNDGDKDDNDDDEILSEDEYNRLAFK